jgi:hypothetical protein
MMQTGQSGYSVGLEWTVVSTGASKPLPQVRVSYLKKRLNTHTFINHALYITLCIFLLCRLKNVHFILNLLAELQAGIIFRYPFSLLLFMDIS